MTYISWFSGLYLEDYFMYKAVTLAGGIREPLLTCSSSKYDREVVRVFQIREHHAKIVKLGRYVFGLRLGGLPS